MVFKKIKTVVILLCILSISLAACSSPENQTQDTVTEAETSVSQTQPTEAATEAAASADIAEEDVNPAYTYTIIDTGQTHASRSPR